MSKGNWFNTRREAHNLRTKEITQEAYTVRIGGAGDNFIEDRVVAVTTTLDGDDFTITVPDGTYPGQRLLVYLEAVGHDETVTVTPDTGDAATLGETGDFVSYEWIFGTTAGWQAIHNQTD